MDDLPPRLPTEENTMIDNDRWILLISILVSLLLLLIIFLTGRWLADRRRVRARNERSRMEDHLMSVDLDSLTAEGYAATKKVADRYGLDLKYIQRRQRTEADRKAMSTRQQEKLLEQVRADRIRQEEMEREAIRSILDEVPEPRHDL